MKAKKPVKKQSGVKQESTAESEGRKADRGLARKLLETAPIPGSEEGQQLYTRDELAGDPVILTVTRVLDRLGEPSPSSYRQRAAIT